MMKKILKIGLGIVISILAVIIIAYILFFGNVRYIFPVELGRIVLNGEINYGASLNRTPTDVLVILDQIEQAQIYVDIEELEQLREKIEGIDDGYIYISYQCPLRYLRYYEGKSILFGEYSTEYYGTYGVFGKDNGNVLYFYYVRQEIDLPFNGSI